MTNAPTPQDIAQRLRDSDSLFKGLSGSELEKITVKMRVSSVASGRLILQQGDQTTGVFFMLSGTAVGQLAAESGRQVMFTEMVAGDHFGELAALDGLERSITISTTSPAQVAVLQRVDFLEALKNQPQIAINLATELGARLRMMNHRVFSLVVHDVDTRVRLHLMQLAQHQEQLINGGTISGAPTHETIASFIGSNREAVSRAIARLSKAGVIQTDRKKIVINDLGRLYPDPGA